MDDEWRPIPDSRGYEVSDLGRVRRGDRILRGCTYSTGYVMHVIYLNDGSKWRVAEHVLVCELFHGSRPEGFECCHINGAKTDNRAANLRWGSRVDNMRDQFLHGTRVRGDTHPRAKLSYEKADEIRLRRASGESLMSLSRNYAVNKKAILNLLAGKTWVKPDVMGV